MIQNGKTFYGNEWINKEKTYHKFLVSQDGIYRINFSTLNEAGISDNNFDKLQVWNYGKQVPIYKGETYIEFVGQRNTIGMDTFLYSNWRKDLLNEDYSLISDDNAYYISLADIGEETLRYEKISPDYTSNLPEKMESFLYTNKYNFVTSFYKPEIAQLKYSHFISSEGFMDGLKNNFTRALTTPFRANQGNASLFLSASTSSNFKQLYDVTLNGQSIATDSVSFLSTNKKRIPLELSQLQDNNNIQIKGHSTSLLLGVSHISITYPRLFNMTGITFTKIINPDNAKRLIEFSQAISGQTYVFDIQNNKCITLDEQRQRLIVDKNAELIFSTDITTIPKLEKVNFFTIPEGLGYLIVSSKKLANTPRGQEGLERYKEYRSSTRGGSFVSDIVFVEDMYDQFGYGVPNHPHTFKNFAHFLKEKYQNLEYVLLVGKGREYNNIRTKAQLAQQNHQTFFVPTYGNSPSDILLFSKGEEAVPFFALGRIAAKNGDDINNYLDKVIEHDIAKEAPQTLEKMWLKNVMHLGGGANNGEQSAIKRFLENMGDTLVNSQFGARINPFYKTTNAAVQSANVEGLKKEMDNGISILTFFGHASVGTFDYSLDVPSAYNNTGKYPFIFSLGCYSGNIHTSGVGISEDYIFAKNKGAIGFIAAAGTATLFSQGVYGIDYYTKMGNDFYGKSIGELLNLIVKEKNEVRSIDPFTFYQQLTLNGDPAIKITSFEKPDLQIRDNSLSTSPSDLNSDLDSFEIQFELYNIGLNTKNAVDIEVQLLDEQLVNYYTISFTTRLPSNRNMEKIKLPIVNNKSGRNFAKIVVDPSNKIPELSEMNNTLPGNGYEFFIRSGDVFISYPELNSSIKYDDEIKVVISSSNSFSDRRTFTLSIDTTLSFSSPIVINENFNEQYIERIWNPKILKIKNARYYIKLEYNDLTSNSKNTVKNSSFVLSDEKEHFWFQSGLNDFKTNETDFRIENGFRYTSGLRSVKIDNGFTSRAGTSVGVSVDFSSYAASLRPWTFMREGIAIAVADTLNGFFVRNNGGDFGSINTSAQASNFCYGFNTKTAEDRKKVIDFLNNHVPNGFVVTVMTILSDENSLKDIKEWDSDTLKYGTSIRKALEAQGALLFDKLISEGPLPYNFIYKNNGGSLGESISEEINTITTSTVSFNVESTTGFMNINPFSLSRKWNKITIEYDQSDQNQTWILLKDKENNLIEKVKISNEISLEEFNKLQLDELKMTVIDSNSTTRKPINIKVIKIYFDPIGDITSLNYNLENQIPKNFNQGEVITFEIPIVSSNREMVENLNITRELIFTDNAKVIDTFIVNSISFLDTVNLKQTINTENFTSDFRIVIGINTTKNIKENNSKNNSAIKNIQINKDLINPTIQAFYENTLPLTSGSILPSNTKLKIVLEDNNILLKTFTKENVLIELTDQNNAVIPLNFSTAVYMTEVKNEKILFTIEFDMVLKDGKYLLTLNGKDLSGNIAGSNFSEIEFEVSSIAQIKNVYNYPNPFSKSTQFVFTVTGALPVTANINIYTISGKLIRSIPLTDYEMMKMGHNMTDYKFDGTDDFGNKLANGVYLFKIEAVDASGSKIPMNKLEKFGKMVILN
jgi:hypothetical protein